MRSQLVAVVVLSTLGGPALADLAPPPDVNRCTVKRHQRPGRECVTCAEQIGDPPRCEDMLASLKFEEQCARRVGSVEERLFCRAKKDAPPIPAAITSVLADPSLPAPAVPPTAPPASAPRTPAGPATPAVQAPPTAPPAAPHPAPVDAAATTPAPTPAPPPAQAVTPPPAARTPPPSPTPAARGNCALAGDTGAGGVLLVCIATLLAARRRRRALGA